MSAETFGKKFSEITVTHQMRIDQINLILTATRNLYTAIEQEIHAETLAENNEPVDPTWDAFRGNGITPNPDGINTDVQDKGEALYNAIAPLLA